MGLQRNVLLALDEGFAKCQISVVAGAIQLNWVLTAITDRGWKSLGIVNPKLGRRKTTDPNHHGQINESNLLNSCDHGCITPRQSLRGQYEM